MNPLRVTEDGAGRNAAPGRLWSSFIDFLGLVAHTGVTLTVPTGANHVMLNRSDNFFLKCAGDVMTSAVYKTNTVAAAICSGTGPELNPTALSLTGVTALSMIAPAAASITLSWYG